MFLQIRMDPDRKEWYRRMAKLAGRTVSDIARDSLDKTFGALEDEHRKRGRL